MTLSALQDERALREALKLLDAERFEQLVHSVVRAQWDEAEKLAAPDGGADTLVPLDGGSRVFQAKHFSDHIRWPQCSKSLTSALKRWSPSRVTFVFARDLSESQKKHFADKLVAAAPDGVVVDWWGVSELLIRLLESDQGLRVARRFLNFGEDTARAIRAQGELTRGARAIDRALAAAEFADTLDPDYRYRVETDAASEFLTTPSQTMRLQRLAGGTRAVVDAVPRSPTTQAPTGAIEFKDDPAGRAAAARFRVALEKNAGVTINLRDAETVRFTGLPAIFADMLEAADLEHGHVTLTAPQWPGRMMIANAEGIRTLDLDFQGAEDPDTQRAELAGLTVELILIEDEGDAGALRINWRYSIDRLATTRDLEVLTFVRALLSGGTAQLQDRGGKIKPLVVSLPDRGPDEYIDELDRYLRALRRIETHLGVTLDGDVEDLQQDWQNVARADAVLERGGRPLSVGTFTATVSADADDFIRGLEGGKVALQQRIPREFAIRGHLVSLGTYEIPLPTGKVVSRVPTPGAPETWDITFEPDSDKRTVQAKLLPRQPEGDTTSGTDGRRPWNGSNLT